MYHSLAPYTHHLVGENNYKYNSELNYTDGILDRCRVGDGGNMLWQFLEFGFLNLWRGELV